MAGIYIHIPFCASRCIYCGFFSTTLHKWQKEYVDALIREYSLRHDYLSNQPIETIYLGGGTPSQLSSENLQRLLKCILSLPLRGQGGLADFELTIECNPDDVTPEFATLLYNIGVNRVSMGMQTFSDERLRFLRRRHTSHQARTAVSILRQAGIQNISIDLMFGFPDETMEDWQHDIEEAILLDVEHISAYSLMYEEGTPLYAMLERGEINEIDEELSRRMYYHLIDRLTLAGYEHYEISNFARPGFRSRHNSSYWNETHYLGLGAGAHSYDGKSRQWNVCDVKEYIEKISAGVIPAEIELIDKQTHYNDLITTALRTSDGISLNNCPNADFLLRNAQQFIDRQLLALTPDNRLHLTREGLYVSDDIMAELMWV